VLAVADAAEAAASPLGQAVTARIESGEGLMGWAVAVDNAAAVAERLGLELSDISRQGLTAKLAGLAEAMAPAVAAGLVGPAPGGLAGRLQLVVRCGRAGSPECLRLRQGCEQQLRHDHVGC